VLQEFIVHFVQLEVIATFYCSHPGCVECNPCPAGEDTRVRYAGSLNCSLCDPGKYKPSKGTELCQFCKDGWYQVNAGQTSCHECPEGCYCPVSITYLVNKCWSDIM
ncbi:hypothetical protein QZH41_009078, partial [Actinostola sp. cb2023]